MASNPINAKSLMEFFEKELGVTCREHTTGRRALDIITEQEQQALQKRVCGTCRFVVNGDGQYTFVEDMICTNSRSLQAVEFVMCDYSCGHWESVDDEV